MALRRGGGASERLLAPLLRRGRVGLWADGPDRQQMDFGLIKKSYFSMCQQTLQYRSRNEKDVAAPGIEPGPHG